MTALSSPPLAPSTCTLSILDFSLPPSSLTWCPLLAGDTGWLACVGVWLSTGQAELTVSHEFWPGGIQKLCRWLVCAPGKLNAWELLPKGEN